jgi:hypothetical protein
MTKILTTLLLFITTLVFSQRDHNGNPIFNSISTNTETINDFQFISNYYTLRNNIENKGSSVYVSDKPTLDEIENAAINLPSDFFVIMNNQIMLNIVMLVNKPTRQYFVVSPTTGKSKQFPCSITGDITENRANEIINEKYDSKAIIKKNKLYFNDKEFAIIPNTEIKEKILDLIKEQKLNIGDSGNIKILSKTDLKELVLKESKEGGKLDFFTEIKGHEMDGFQIKPGIFDTKQGIALYKWGRSNYDLGVNTVEEALEFWSKFKGRQPNQKEKEYIKLGFNKELEK